MHHNTERVQLKEYHANDTRRKEKKYKIFMRTPNRKRPLRRERCRWEKNIKMDVNRIRGSVSRQGLPGGLQ